MGLLSSHGGPPGLLKPEQAHLEQQMNMLSVLRAYSSENLAAFNGGLASSTSGSGGGSKRVDAPGESIPPVSCLHTVGSQLIPTNPLTTHTHNACTICAVSI